VRHLLLQQRDYCLPPTTRHCSAAGRHRVTTGCALWPIAAPPAAVYLVTTGHCENRLLTPAAGLPLTATRCASAAANARPLLKSYSSSGRLCGRPRQSSAPPAFTTDHCKECLPTNAGLFAVNFFVGSINWHRSNLLFLADQYSCPTIRFTDARAHFF
jgi:hypothetical protein